MTWIAPLRVAAVAAALSLGIANAADPPYTIVAGDLASPRGLAFGPGGRLYFAQAGLGDDGAGNPTATGKISEIRYPWLPKPAIRDLVTGLVSITDEHQPIGVSGLSVHGNGNVYAIMARSNVDTGFASRLGHLLKVSQGGQVRDVANVGDFDFAWTGDHVDLAPADFPDANPYGVLALGDRIYVADAGANTLDLVRPNGSVQVVAFFPNPKLGPNDVKDATPTCVAQGPDGALYIGTLSLAASLGSSSPQAVVYRVDPDAVNADDLGTITNVATPWATGLWPIAGCTFGPDGTFYASELVTHGGFPGAVSGDVVKIAFDNPAVHTSLTGPVLADPAGVAVGADGAVYVANGSAFGHKGQVLRLTDR